MVCSDEYVLVGMFGYLCAQVYVKVLSRICFNSSETNNYYGHNNRSHRSNNFMFDQVTDHVEVQWKKC